VKRDVTFGGGILGGRVVSPGHSRGEIIKGGGKQEEAKERGHGFRYPQGPRNPPNVQKKRPPAPGGAQ